MNLIHRSIWNDQTGTFVAVSENARSAGKKSSSCTAATGGSASFSLKILSAALMLACGASVYAQPTGGAVVAGSASIGGSAGNMVINQTTQNVAINWQSFGINAGESVQFVQPGSTSVALNRVIGSDPSNILGNLSANGKVFLVNPNGVLFGQGASVNVGGLVASTLAISDANFMNSNYQFSGAGAGTVVNQGTLNAADGGFVTLLGANVSNQGVISAQLGSVALAAGNAVTLDIAGDKLLKVNISQGAVNALVENGGMIRADGGQVLMTTQTAASLLSNAVNNTGVVQAQTLQNIDGTIKLLGGMDNGTVAVGGTLDASAPNGGKGGFIETSAAHVNVANDVKVTTAAANGSTGKWLIDPLDFVIGSAPGNNIAGTTLSAQLVTTSVEINTATGPGAALPGNGDIFVNDAVSWTASGAPTTLTLFAVRDINVNAAITATEGNFVACCGRDINVNAAITTTRGSVLLGADKGNLNINAPITTTDGNLSLCAGNDIRIADQITLTRGSNIPAQSLGLPVGLVMSAGYAGTGPGVTGGTVIYAPLAPPTVVTGPNAPVIINYNPSSYATPTDYAPNFVLTLGSTLTQHMLVFPDGGGKAFDGTTTTTFTGLKGAPANVTLTGPGTANFDDAAVGNDKTIIFSGFTLTGADAALYALPSSCCGPAVSRTTASITPAVVIPPVIVPPAVIPPGFMPTDMELSVVPPLTMLPINLTVQRLPETPVAVAYDQPVVEEVPEVYVAPVRVPKQDRN